MTAAAAFTVGHPLCAGGTARLATDPRRQVPGDVVAANILGDARRANYEAVPRVVYTDPQAAAFGVSVDRFGATVPLAQVPKTATFTRAYAEQNGFLTLLSDGERLTGAYALGARGGRVAATGHARDPGACPARRPGRHHPAVPDVLGDLRGGVEDAAGRDGGALQESRRGSLHGDLTRRPR